MARSSVRGLGRALRAVGRVPEAMRQARAETLQTWADRVQAAADAAVPVRSGHLKGQIDQKVNARYGRAEVGVWNREAMEYAWYVEHGTSSMQDQPYLRPAFNRIRPEVTRTYRAALRRHLGAG